ncbi:redoxin domain-containing protein [Haliea sp. E17]|uniref:redoxin domain-containing protein n=1 Tax=Haliea sp. E17 TaxID=3401576 RepID=UPI003AAF2F74
MKKTRLIFVVFALLLGLLWAFRAPLKQLAYDQLTRDMFVAGDSDSFDPGPLPGSAFPGVNATWQGRQIRLLDEFAGPSGTLLVAARSVAWCPFCMRQLVQLQAHKAAYDAAGIALVAITYDDPEVQRAFAAQWGIEYPILHDVDTLTFRTLGILNRDYQPGDAAYGIPYPGMLVIDPAGKVVGKLFLEDYSVRVDAGAALEFARAALAAPPGR